MRYLFPFRAGLFLLLAFFTAALIYVTHQNAVIARTLRADHPEAAYTGCDCSMTDRDAIHGDAVEGRLRVRWESPELEALRLDLRRQRSELPKAS